MSRRLPPQNSEVIDREHSFTFEFEGQRVEALEGDTIASALAAQGRDIFSRSFKYHRPRGLMCCSGHCPNCLVQVGDEPNVRACTRQAEPGLRVKPQNVWPSLDFDILAWIGLGDMFMPVGFYYKTFIRPQFMWPFYEAVIRHIAGLGKVHMDTEPEHRPKEYLHYDVVVVGGGPAGMEAALAASDKEVRVALLDENPSLGGHLRYSGDTEQLKRLRAEVEKRPHLDVYTETTVLGRWEEQWLSAVQDERLLKIRAAALVVATGAVEQPFLFDNNDLPGIMLASGCERLLRLHSVSPGERAVVYTCNDSGWEAATILKEFGVELAAVVDQRESTDCRWFSILKEAGVKVLMEASVVRARGQKRVSHVTVKDSEGRTQVIGCDLVAVAGGWVPQTGLLSQAGGQIQYQPEHGEFLPSEVGPGTFLAGRVAGTHDLTSQLSEGRWAGRAAAHFLGQGKKPKKPKLTEEPARAPGEYCENGKKRFVCVCEDVTVEDLQQGIGEGYSSIELLKRYSTVSMGPCQGRMCSMNSIRVCGKETGREPGEVGTTTSRPPMVPVKLGVLAGQNMEPVRYTPLHDWHIANDAKMMVAGLWMRPEHYGDPQQEVRLVRKGVGLIDLSTLGKFSLVGPKVPEFLEKIYVNKWSKLKVGRVRYGVMTNSEGVVFDDGVTACLGKDRYLMTTTSSGAARVYETMQWWLQSGWGDGVLMTPQTELFAAMNLAGPQSRAVLAGLTKTDVSNEAFPYLHLKEMTIAGVPCRVMRIGFTGELSYEIHCPRGSAVHLWEAIMEAGELRGITPFGVEAQRVMRLEKGHLIVGQDTDATSDPLSAGMKWAVKLDKEDFLGRWALSQMDERGTASRLVGYVMQNARVVPHEGEQVVARGQTIGWVSSARYSPTLSRSIGLCWVPKELADDGSTITILTRGQEQEAVVSHGPFFDPDGGRLRS